MSVQVHVRPRRSVSDRIAARPLMLEKSVSNSCPVSVLRVKTNVYQRDRLLEAGLRASVKHSLILFRYHETHRSFVSDTRCARCHRAILGRGLKSRPRSIPRLCGEP